MRAFEKQLLQLVAELVSTQKKLLKRRQPTQLTTPPAARAYSMKPSAIRNRRMLGYGEFADKRQQPRQQSDAHRGRTPVKLLTQPRLVVPSAFGLSHKEAKSKDKAAPTTRDRFLLAQAYSHFRLALKSATGRDWFEPKKVPPLERKMALVLLRETGSLLGMTNAIERFKKLWGDSDWVKRPGSMDFSFKSIATTFNKWPCGCEKIQKRKYKLHYVGPHKHERRPRAAPAAAALPPPTQKEAVHAIAGVVGGLQKRGLLSSSSPTKGMPSTTRQVLARVFAT